jgi:hypothetical protein
VGKIGQQGWTIKLLTVSYVYCIVSSWDIKQKGRFIHSHTKIIILFCSLLGCSPNIKMILWLQIEYISEKNWMVSLKTWPVNQFINDIINMNINMNIYIYIYILYAYIYTYIYIYDMNIKMNINMNINHQHQPWTSIFKWIHHVSGLTLAFFAAHRSGLGHLSWRVEILELTTVQVTSWI